MNTFEDTQGTDIYGTGSTTDPVSQGTMPANGQPHAGSPLDIMAIQRQIADEVRAEMRGEMEQLRNQAKQSLRDTGANLETTILQRVLQRTENEGRLIDRYVDNGVITPEQAQMDRMALRNEIEQQEVARVMQAHQAQQFAAAQVQQYAQPQPQTFAQNDYATRAQAILMQSGLTTADPEAKLIPQNLPYDDPRKALDVLQGIVATATQAKNLRLASQPQRQYEEPPMIDMGGGTGAGGFNEIANIDDPDELFRIAKQKAGGSLIR